MLQRSGLLSAPVADLFQALATGMLEEPDHVAGVFKFVDVGPDFGAPRGVVSSGLAAGCAASVQSHGRWSESDRRCAGQFYKDAANLFYFLVRPEKMLVAEKVSEAQFAGLEFGF